MRISLYRLNSMKKLNEIQQKLSVPKQHKNSFGNYNYRNLEDILEAVKPLLGEATLTIEDEIVNIGNRYYIKATAKLKEGDEIVSNTAYAREAETKRGMDDSQITGATSSYARKYCLNGLFCIDDTRDADSQKPEEPKDLKQIAGLMKIATREDAIKLYGTLTVFEKKDNDILEAVKINQSRF